MRSRFAAVRVRPAHRDDWRSTPRLEEWLLIEWPRGEAAPIKYWLSTLPPTATSIGLGPPGDVALAHRAGLPRAEGRAGAGSLRRPGLARLPSSRLALHRGVRIPRRRAAHAFPP